MRLNENNLIMEQYQQVLDEAKKKPSAGLTKKQKSDVAKKARAGKDIGKKGPGFAKMAKAAGGGEKGKKIAAAAMWKSIKRESADIASIYGQKLLGESMEEEKEVEEVEEAMEEENEMGEALVSENDPMIPKVEKILAKMTEDYGSEDLAVEELSKWDEDEMNEYYNNHFTESE